MTRKIFLHGVPDTPEMWRPLFDCLGLDLTPETAPALPGFVTPRPRGFDGSKESYVNWFIEHLERVVAESGPPDLVAHDWGSMILVRTASIRPDLMRSWIAINAVPHEDDLWHGTAKTWQTPIIGELSMLATRKSRMERGLRAMGMSPEIAKHEADAFKWHMKSSILSLYRSAMKIGSEWYPDFPNLAANGLLIWGDKDPFGPISLGEGFAARFDIPIVRVKNAGHWPFFQQTDLVADTIKNHWVKQG